MPMVGVFGPEDFSHRARGGSTRPVLREARALPTPELEWTPEIERETAHLYNRVKVGAKVVVRQSAPAADETASAHDATSERVAMTRLVKSKTTNTVLAKSEFHSIN